MKNPLSICFIAPEIHPFVKGGPLAELVGSLPIALKELGHDIRVIMPNYKAVNERKYVLRDVIRLKDMSVPLGSREIKVSAKSAFLPDSKVQAYFIDHKEYFGRDGIYINPKTGKPYPDNDERFAAFCMGCIQTLRVLHWQPDIIHCFEWPTGFLPLALRALLADDPFFSQTHTAFSFSDFQNLALFPAETLAKIGLDKIEHPILAQIKKDDRISLLMAGVAASELLVFNSESLLQELFETGNIDDSLLSLLKARRNDTAGILPGIDGREWDPETDSHLVMNYNGRSVSKKTENKKALMTRLNMPFRPDVPVLGFLTALTETAGADLFVNSFEKLLKLGLQLVVVERSESPYSKSLHALIAKHPGKACLVPRPDQGLYHLIVAGLDMALFPSRLEISGKEALHCLRYGTIPIAKATGIFKEVVLEFDPDKESGTGFLFQELEPSSMLQAVERALQIFRDAKKWQKLVRNALKQAVTWDHTATRYTKVYQKIVGNKK